jgi:hypothetical protein
MLDIQRPLAGLVVAAMMAMNEFASVVVVPSRRVYHFF